MLSPQNTDLLLLFTFLPNYQNYLLQRLTCLEKFQPLESIVLTSFLCTTIKGKRCGSRTGGGRCRNFSPIQPATQLEALFFHEVSWPTHFGLISGTVGSSSILQHTRTISIWSQYLNGKLYLIDHEFMNVFLVTQIWSCIVFISHCRSSRLGMAVS